MRSTHLSNLLSTNGYSVPLSDKSHIRGYNSRTCHLFLLTSLPMSNPQAGPPVHSRIRTHRHTTQWRTAILKRKEISASPGRLSSPRRGKPRQTLHHQIQHGISVSPPKQNSGMFLLRRDMGKAYILCTNTCCASSSFKGHASSRGDAHGATVAVGEKGGKRGPRPRDNGSCLSSSARCRRTASPQCSACMLAASVSRWLRLTA